MLDSDVEKPGFPWRRSRRILSTVFRRSYRKKSTYLNAVLFLHSLRRSAITLNCNSSTCILVIAWSTNGNVCTDRLQSDRPSRDVFPSCFSEIDRLINQAVIRRVTFAVEKLSLGGRRKQRDVSTNQSNNFGVSPKRF